MIDPPKPLGWTKEQFEAGMAKRLTGAIHTIIDTDGTINMFRIAEDGTLVPFNEVIDVTTGVRHMKDLD